MQSSHRSIGTDLSFRLERLGLSPEQFAPEARLSPTAIRNLERGRVKNPRRSTVRNLSDALTRLEKQMYENKENPQW